MTDSLDAMPRRVPVQKRSQAKVNSILSAARRLVELNGVDQLTSLQVAKEANVPVGSVYFYFPTPMALVDELAKQWLHGLRTQFEALLLAPMPTGGWRALLDALLTATYGRTGALQLRRFEMAMTRALDFYPELQTTRTQHAEAVSLLLARLLQKAGATWPDAQLLRLARLGFEMIGALDQYLDLPGVVPEEALKWTRQALQGLLSPCLEEAPDTPHETVPDTLR